MKAVDRSQKARELVAQLIQKMDSLDELPLAQLVASRLREIIGRAKYLDRPDDDAVSKIEQELDQALEVWTQYDTWRAIVKAKSADASIR